MIDRVSWPHVVQKKQTKRFRQLPVPVSATSEGPTFSAHRLDLSPTLAHLAGFTSRSVLVCALGVRGSLNRQHGAAPTASSWAFPAAYHCITRTQTDAEAVRRVGSCRGGLASDAPSSRICRSSHSLPSFRSSLPSQSGAYRDYWSTSRSSTANVAGHEPWDGRGATCEVGLIAGHGRVPSQFQSHHSFNTIINRR